VTFSTEKIGSRGLLITCTTEMFSFPTAVYAIGCADYILLCDTYLGAAAMQVVVSLLKDTFGDKPITVFNTHADYDHVWGNTFFKDSKICAHERTHTLMAEKNEAFRMALKDLACGENETYLPNEIFFDSFIFHNEEITLFHAPGHTADSSLLYDARDGVIFAGDMWEAPLPCVAWHHFDVYLRSLHSMIEMKPHIMLSAHSGRVTDEIVTHTLRYIEALASGREPELNGIERAVHMTNRKLIYASRIEEQLRMNSQKYSPQLFTETVIRSLEMSYSDFCRTLDIFSL